MAVILTALVGIMSLGPSGSTTGDPSFYVPSEHAFTTLVQMPPTVLDHDGVLLVWNNIVKEFVLKINSNDVNDLVTFEDADGEPSFEGQYVSGNPEIFGSVLLNTSTDYSVEFNEPNELPMLFEITNVDGETPVVDATKNCNCDDGIGLTCTSRHCRQAKSCSAATAMCVWVAVS